MPHSGTPTGSLGDPSERRPGEEATERAGAGELDDVVHPLQAPAKGRDGEERTCRLCWGEEDDGFGGELLSPCRCIGSLRFIHRRCLYDWQRTLRSQGLGRRSSTCELCKAPYAVAADQVSRGRRRRHSVDGLPLHNILLTARSVLADAFRVNCWPGIALRLWKAYVMASGMVKAVRVGVAGFAAGMSIGRTLIEEQTSLLGSVLSSMNTLLGSPYAELLWCQAVGALLVGMVSELVYCGVLGALGGVAYGFATGYVSAIKGSVQLVTRVSAGAVTAVAWFALRSVRRAASIVLKV